MMLEGGSSFRFVDKSSPGLWVADELRREELKRYGAIELEVLGPVDHAHPADAELLEDGVVRNRLTNESSHGSSFKRRHGGHVGRKP